jgi:hypothetical protein
MAGSITLVYECEEYPSMLIDYCTFDSRKTVARDLRLAFSVPYRASSLKMLSLYFGVYYTGRLPGRLALVNGLSSKRWG